MPEQEVQVIEHNPSLVLLGADLHRCVQVCIKADGDTGAAMLTKANAIQEARQKAKRGQWGAFLKAINMGERMAARYCAIARRSAEDAVFRALIESGQYAVTIAAMLVAEESDRLQLLADLDTPPTRRELTAMLRQADEQAVAALPSPAQRAAQIFYEAHAMAFNEVGVSLQCDEEGLQLFEHGSWHRVSADQALEALRKAERTRPRPAAPAQAGPRAYASPAPAEWRTESMRDMPEPPDGWCWVRDADTGAVALRHNLNGFRISGNAPASLVAEAVSANDAFAALRGWHVTQNAATGGYTAQHPEWGWAVHGKTLAELASQAGYYNEVAAKGQQQKAVQEAVENKDTTADHVFNLSNDLLDAAERGQHPAMKQIGFELFATLFRADLRSALNAAVQALDEEGRAQVADQLRMFLG